LFSLDDLWYLSGKLMDQARSKSYFAVQIINGRPGKFCPDVFSRTPVELGEAFVFARCGCLSQSRQ
jgi:hypothetical protein